MSDVFPREVEVGDRLEIAGQGLPIGRTARVTFRGDLHRPGEASGAHAEVTTEGEVTSPERVEILYTSDLQTEFCGAGNSAAHTTFEGTVEVAFAATRIGAPPVAASLAHATIDFRPPLPATSAAVREGERLVAFAGIHLVDPEARGAGLGVASVEPGSRAEGAGLRDGDEIETFDGVRALSIADLAVVEGSPVASLVVRRAGSTENLTMQLAGFRPAPTADRFALLAALALFIGALLVRSSPVSTRLGMIAQRIRLRGAALLYVPITGWSKKPGVLPRSLALSLALISVPCAIDLFPLRSDVPAVLGTVALASVLIALVAHGFRDALRVAAWHLVSASSVIGVVLMSGSLRISEIASTQSGAPWTWIVFRGPAGLALALAYVASMLASIVRSSTNKGGFTLDLESLVAVTRIDLPDALRLGLACSLAVPLFLGHAAAPRALSFATSFVQAGALFWLTAALPTVMARRWRFRELVPASGFAFALAFAQASLHLDRRIELIVDSATLAVVVLGVVHLSTTVRALGRPSGATPSGATGRATCDRLRPSPFL